tara:strand:+ start:266 stop:748 length:483 start_codon:yes stop_codon:yes gene_type:complete
LRYLYLTFILLFPIDTIAEILEFQAKVVKVIDGDSMIVQNKEGKFPIRIKYIDAPEIKQRYGKESKAFLQKLIYGKSVFISSPYKDRYNRYLSEVYIYNNDIAIYVNAKLIKSGNAWVYKSYRTNEYLMNLENFAKTNIKGLWSNKKPTKPWVFRKIDKK